MEDVETFASATAGRSLARMMCDPIHAGVAEADDLVLVGMGVFSLGGTCWRGEVVVVDLGLGGDASAAE